MKEGEVNANLVMALQIIDLINAATPGIAQLILLIRDQSTVSVVVMLDKADAQFQANLKQIEEWQTRMSENKKGGGL